MQSKCTYNHCVLCSAVNIVYWERNKEFLFFKHKTFASERSLWQQHSVNSSVSSSSSLLQQRFHAFRGPHAPCVETLLKIPHAWASTL